MFGIALRFYFSLGLAIGGCVSAMAQTKVEDAIYSEFKSKKLVRVLVVTRPEISQPSASASFSNPSSYLASALGEGAMHVKPIGGLPIASAEITQEALSKLKDDPNVAFVTRDIPMPPTLMDSVPLIGGDKVHQLGFKGTDRTVAVLDTGVQRDHPALAGSIVAEACFSTKSSTRFTLSSLCPGQLDLSTVAGAAGQCPPSLHGCEHGTHVSGIIAGHQMVFNNKTFEGVAPAAKIVPIQVFTLFDDPETCGSQAKCIQSFTSDQLRALEWVFKNAEQHKIAAINMSLGTGYHASNCDSTSALTEIIERLRAKGIPTVIAAGNDTYYDGVEEPACISSAVSVAALKKDGTLDLDYTNVSTLIHIAAPGTAIVSSVTGSKYAAISGTSMAAPHVAAAFALLRQEYPNDTVTQLENRLINGAPIVTDPRTETKLPRLELTHVSPTPGQPESTHGPAAAASANAPEVAVPVGTASSGSFIIKTDKPANEVQSILHQNCGEFTCTLKPIGENTMKLDLTVKGTVAPADRPRTVPDAATVRKLFPNDPSIKVFDNRLSAPR